MQQYEFESMEVNIKTMRETGINLDISVEDAFKMCSSIINSKNEEIVDEAQKVNDLRRKNEQHIADVRKANQAEGAAANISIALNKQLKEMTDKYNLLANEKVNESLELLPLEKFFLLARQRRVVEGKSIPILMFWDLAQEAGISDSDIDIMISKKELEK